METAAQVVNLLCKKTSSSMINACIIHPYSESFALIFEVFYPRTLCLNQIPCLVLDVFPCRNDFTTKLCQFLCCNIQIPSPLCISNHSSELHPASFDEKRHIFVPSSWQFRPIQPTYIGSISCGRCNELLIKNAISY